MRELISVLLPIYNPNLTYFDEAIKSINNQTYPFIELIISIDNIDSKLELDSILSNYPNLNWKYVNNKRSKGIFGNLNNAILNSNGSYIQLFSQDDRMKDLFLLEQIKGFRDDSEVGMVFSNFVDINANGIVINPLLNHTFSPAEDRRIGPELAHRYFLKYGCLPGNISPVMLKRDVINKIGLFNEDLKYAGDFEYWVRVSTTYSIKYLALQSLEIRTHKNRASHLISNSQLLNDLIVVYRLLLKLVHDSEKYKAIKLINRKVGVSFIHHTLKQIIFGNEAFKSFKYRLIELNQFPFSSRLSVIYYFINLPVRGWKYLSNKTCNINKAGNLIQTNDRNASY